MRSAAGSRRIVRTPSGGRTHIDLEMALESAPSNLQIAIVEGKAEITHDPLHILMPDHIQIVQLFQNLTGNAIEFRS